jgi:hypothetical protein
MRAIGVLSTIVLMPLPAYGAGTVTFDVSSPCADCTVGAGELIEWTITVTVSTGDNYGLALAAVDLVQSPGNPELLDLIPGAAPADMQDFDDPNGITNPDPGSVGSGYGGTPVGAAGAKDLRQVGGAQNTFGVPGDVAGLDYNVRPGVGQSGAQVLATGSFEAPATYGDYTFSLENAIANTLVEINSPPDFSPVSAATVVLSSASFSFWVSIPGDVDHDADVDLSDLAALIGVYGYCIGHPYYNPAADFDCSGCVDLSDLADLIGHYGEGT